MRNGIRRSIGASVAVLAIGLLASGCDWTQFANGFGHTGDNAGENRITPANVSKLSLRFTTIALSQNGEDFVEGQAAIANGVMYVAGEDGNLYAYDASGTTNCSGSPTSCSPLWTAYFGGGYGLNGTPAVSNGVVYIMSNTTSSSSNNTIYAFDAAGKTGCSGTPTVCSPLWTASVSDAEVEDLTLYNGMLYAQGGGTIEVFDATGTVGCTGTPKTCSPLWSTTDLGLGGDTVTISSNHIAYARGGGGTTIYAFDASGKNGCTGSPAVCSPLWSYTTGSTATSPVVSGSTLYVDTLGISGTAGNPTLNGGLEAFDAYGSTNCAGTPAVCTPLWQSSSAYASQEPPAVGNGDVYVPGLGPIGAFDANGSTNCSGTPKVCTPLWTTSVNGQFSPLAIGGSVLYATVSGHDAYAFDATGVQGCANAVCSPLWSLTSLPGQPHTTLPGLGISVANGNVYFSGFTNYNQGSLLISNGFVDALSVP